MDETNFDWDDLRLFLAVARGGGLAAASDATGKSPPTLGRRMLQLERRLGKDLFIRKARGYLLTEAGTEFLGQIRGLEAQLLPMIETDADARAPLVKISAGTWVTELLCRNAPTIIGADYTRLRFIAAEAVLDIGRREALVGIRNRRPDDIALAVRKIGRVEFAVYAVSEDVRPWIHVLGSTPSAAWVAAQIGPDGAIEVTSPRNARDLALAGSGRVVLPTFVGDRTDGLQRMSGPIDPLAHEQWLVMHNADRHIPVVRATIDRIFAVLKDAYAGP